MLSPIHVTVPNATLLIGLLIQVLGCFYAVSDLDSFFCLVFSWLQSPNINYHSLGMIAVEYQWFCPPSVIRFHYMDGVMSILKIWETFRRTANAEVKCRKTHVWVDLFNINSYASGRWPCWPGRPWKPPHNTNCWDCYWSNATISRWVSFLRIPHSLVLEHWEIRLGLNLSCLPNTWHS